MLVWSDLRDWLVSLGGGIDPAWYVEGPHIEKLPDQIVTVTLLSGTGYSLEGALDGPSFQVRARGRQGWDQGSAEKLANQVDSLLFHASFPARIGDTVIQIVDRVGGAPAPLGDPDIADRFEYVCTYRMTVSN
jgi:Bacteriophage minor capsid protein